MKGFRTVIFNLLAAVVPLLETMDVTHLMGMNNEWAATYCGIVAGINLYLRSKTDTAIFEKR